jgi:hypothetical protein
VVAPSRINKHTYISDYVIVGSSLAALLHSYFTGFPCIYIDSRIPFRFDFTLNDKVKNHFGIPGASDRELWELLVFVLSISGKLPMADKTSSISIQDDVMKATTSRSRLARFKFKKLLIYDDTGVSGLPLLKKSTRHLSRTLDWFDVRSGMEHEHEILTSDQNFVKEIIFYPSERMGSQKKRIRKDLVAVSYLSEDQILDFDYSSTMARFKVTQMMKDAGIKGARNGRDTFNPELYRYYSVKIESADREIEHSVENKYELDSRFDFFYDDPNTVAEKFLCDSDNHATKLMKIIKKYK